ncbi:MAG: glycosyltransferase family 39 protein [Nitrospinota bacterium]|nr:glycosyltransferase family 39 protein [Nitrospinota bacterium]
MSSVLKIRGRKDALHSLALLAIGLLLLMAPVGDAPNLQIKEARVVFLQNAPVILWLAVWWASVLLYLRLAFGREDFKKSLGPGVRTGLIFHLGLLLLDFIGDMGGGRISLSRPFIAYLHVVTPVGFGAIAWWVSGHWTVRPEDPVTKRGESESRLCTLLALLLVWSLLQTLWARQFLLFGVLLIIYAAFWKGGTATSVLLERRYWLIADRFSGETAFLVPLFFISLLSLFFIVYQASNGFTQFYEYFYGVYLNWARDLLAGRPVPSGEATGYWVFVAAVFRISGESKVALQIAQIVINASIPLLGYFVARRLAPKAVARLAALILTFNFIHQWDAVNFHWSILVTFYSLTAIAAFLGFSESRGKGRWIYLTISGLAFGLLVAVRTENALFVPVFLWWHWRRRRREPEGARLLIGTPKVATAVVLLALLGGAPFAAVNYLNMGTFYPVGNEGGKVGSQYALQDIWSQYYYYALPGGENPIKEPARSWREIKKDPLGFIGRLFVKGGQETPWPGGSIVQRLQNGIPILFSTAQWSYFDFFYFKMLSRWHLYLNFYAALLAGVGIWALAKDPRPHPFWSAVNAYLIARYFMHVFLTNHPEGSYRYASPFLPFVSIYVALGIWIIWRAERPRSTRPVRPAASGGNGPVSA